MSPATIITGGAGAGPAALLGWRGGLERGGRDGWREGHLLEQRTVVSGTVGLVQLQPLSHAQFQAHGLQDFCWNILFLAVHPAPPFHTYFL